MAKTTRQTAIFGVEDWRSIYSTYREADFQSYDFETLRKSFIDYIRLYYPENFNDYIESSEFIALLDVMAFMGQAISYRMDLNTRENFLDTTERRDSAVRLAQLVGYNPKRNQSAQGFLKVLAVSTTETVFDYNGTNLERAVIAWNDPTNPDWKEQITTIVNASLINSQKYGRPGASSTVLGVKTDEYSINLEAGYLPVIPFSTEVNNTAMGFEVVSATTQNENYIYEPAPKPNSPFNILYRNDGLGYGSANTGFFFLFKQGSLQSQDFVLDERVSNRVVNLGINGVNENDIWLYQINSNGDIIDNWTKVESIYDTTATAGLSTTQRKLYSITSRANDAINLNFGDGVFSDVPLGLFRSFMRVSNGLNYVINPTDIQAVQIPITYVSRSGRIETITFTVSLTNAVSNAKARETLDEIKQRAPAKFYTQNRMVNGEDYNNFPYTLFNSIIKSKALNRTSLGISRYLDLTDPTGKYSTTNLFGSDGVIYREDNLYNFTFTWNDINDITDVIVNSVQPILAKRNMLQFYYNPSNFTRLSLESSPSLQWNSSSSLVNETTGYFYNTIENYSEWDNTKTYGGGEFVIVASGANQGYYMANQAVPVGIEITNVGYWTNLNTTTAQKYAPVGVYAAGNNKYITVGALIKFVSPDNTYFDANNRLQSGSPSGPDEKTVIWATVTGVVLDGTNYNTGNLSDGTGPVTLNNYVPSQAIATSIIPIFVTDLDANIEAQIIEQIQLNRDFGIGYDYLTASWYLISETNLAANSAFSLLYAQNQAGANLDSSWIVKFTTNGSIYTVTSRAQDYFFASVLQTRFFFDNSKKIYDTKTGSVIDDYINILKVNNKPQSAMTLGSDIRTNIVGQPIQADGFVNDFVVTVSFTDSDGDGVADNPDFFDDVVGPTGSPISSHLVFFEKTIDFDNLERYLPMAAGAVDANYPTLDQIEMVKNQFNDGQVFYAYTQDAFYTLNVSASLARTLTLDTTNEYKVATGRNNLYFQYKHNSPNTRRIDPSSSNIVDLYVVTNAYYNAYRNYINDSTNTIAEPSRPTIDELTTEYSKLQDYKMISDNVIVNSVRFKPLFGSKASVELQGTIKVVPHAQAVVSASEIKSRVLSAINSYFNIDNWDFGQTFYFSELSSYLHSMLGDIISSVVLVPRDVNKTFGDLYEIHSEPDEIFVNAVSINDIEVIGALTSTVLKTSA